MKTFILACLLFLTTGLYAQTEPNCAANANADDTICHRDLNLYLNAVPSGDYATPLESGWSILSVPPAAAGNVNILTPTNSLTSTVTCSVYPLPIGPYTFVFKVKCKNGVPALDTVTILVQPDVTQAVITMPDGTAPPDDLKTCKSIVLKATIPGVNEDYGKSYTLNDGLLDITYNTTTGELTITRKEHPSSNQGNCKYQVVYSIGNGGCFSYDTVSIYFVGPQDPNHDGLIEGRVYGGCPKCGNVLILQGDRPGCGATGHWTLLDPSQIPYVHFSNVNPGKGDATATVSQPGTYTFLYCTAGGDPCPPSCDTVTCTVLSLTGANLGPDQHIFTCDSVIQPGNYDFTIPNIPNALITHDNNSSWLTISQPNSTTIRIGVNVPYYTWQYGTVQVAITATQYFLDPECDGSYELTPINLPSNDPEEVEDFLQNLISQGGCIEACSDAVHLEIRGAPHIELHTDTVNFLCSNGSELVRLADYYKSWNSGNPNIEEIHVLYQPGTDLDPVIYGWQNTLLQGGDNSHFIFEIYSAWIDPITNDTCSSTDTLYVNLFTPKNVTAGSDQFKCFNEPTILNGNDPYNGQAMGTWQQVNCGSNCTVTYADPHDPNTQIFFTGITWNDLPLDIYFEWSFTATDTNCRYADTTIVHIDTCLIACDRLGLQVTSECIGDSIVLAVSDQYGHLIGYPYSLLWNNGQTGNPVTVADPGGNYAYSVEVRLLINDRKICMDTLSGNVSCDTTPLICGISLVESCDRCGNVVVTAVDANGIPVPYSAYHDTFRWVVFGDASATSGVVHSNVGSITVHPDACYSLLYEHFYYSNPNVPEVPGTQDSICRIQFPKTCVSIECEGPCDNFPIFHIAGCGDDLDVTYNLTFPYPCTSVTGGFYGTLALFDENWNPLNIAPYVVTWENNQHTQNQTAQISTINTVRIEDPNGCCFWEGGYSVSCMCSCEPHSLQCEQPITKYCNQNGTVTYIPGPPQIVWNGVPGAASYELEISFANVDECCTNNPVPPTQIISIVGTAWVFPSTWTCFTVRVRAVNPNSICKQTEWSDPYRYCRAEITCSPVITVCGCCHGERAGENTGIKTVVVSEEALSVYLQQYPGVPYSSLEAALNAIGEGQSLAPAFAVYPNPVNDILNIRPAEWVKGTYNISIQDLLQREWQNAGFIDSEQTSIHIGQLPGGIYLLSIRDSNGELVMTQKVIVSKQ